MHPAHPEGKKGINCTQEEPINNSSAPAGSRRMGKDQRGSSKKMWRWSGDSKLGGYAQRQWLKGKLRRIDLERFERGKAASASPSAPSMASPLTPRPLNHNLPCSHCLQTVSEQRKCRVNKVGWKGEDLESIQSHWETHKPPLQQSKAKKQDTVCTLILPSALLSTAVRGQISPSPKGPWSTWACGDPVWTNAS